ncbi:MAG: DUF4123 domain-containing protein [Rhodocyclaceae bacterium]|nr:DUF4123 domain-containing protein [Rhodocyclaceae bacterium]MBX3668193.1 DUF4123 domain-containing protein [Rhodocyclaceae bacterium]
MPDLTRILWRNDETAVFVLLDGAATAGLLDRLYGADGPEFVCLYRGELAPDIAEVAPYLARLEKSHAFTEWLFSGWGQHWCSYLSLPAPVELQQLRYHFRKLNRVYGPDGEPLLFRYYDPRVLRSFAPTCDAAQLAELFGPVERFLVEAADAAVCTEFSVANGELVSRDIAVS